MGEICPHVNPNRDKPTIINGMLLQRLPDTAFGLELKGRTRYNSAIKSIANEQ